MVSYTEIPNLKRTIIPSIIPIPKRAIPVDIHSRPVVERQSHRKAIRSHQRYTTDTHIIDSNKQKSRQSSDYQLLTWSGKRDSDPRPQPWQGCALPTELFPQIYFPEPGLAPFPLRESSFPAFRDCKYKSKNFILQNFPAIFVS